ncbi:MAG: CDP-diacylglycerol--glycerol-3-phosphate 3-phosphatidyltransferase [Verrucomicrobiota bacterium]
MNLPNQLTVSRFVLTGLFLVAMFSRSPVNDTIALVLFSIAGLTDYFDGKIARERKLITNFGILMDPLADKILTCSAFIALVERSKFNPDTGALPAVSVEAWMAVIIVARELAITGLRLLAASKGVTLAAERFGKHKTISQIVAIITLLVLDAHIEWWPWLRDAFGLLLPWLGHLSLWVTVLLTFTSGAIYLWKNRQIYLEDM